MTRVRSINPATGVERELDVEETTPSEVTQLTERAKNVALDVARRPLTWRSSMLRAMADELEADAANLVELAIEETALTRARLEGELRRTAFQLRFFANVVQDGAFLAISIDHATDSPMGSLPDLRRLNVPLGPVGVFGSSNFPFAFSVPGGDTASALAAGCPVVIKAHPAHPATSRACFDALTRGAASVNAPEGLLALVFGFDAGVALVDAPGIAAVGFTGSVPAGRALWARANARPTPIPFYGELGAANPLVVTQSAATQRGVEIGTGIAGSMTLGVGQFCTKPGLLFIPRGDDGDALVSALVSALEDTSPMTMLSVGIAKHFRSGSDTVKNSDTVVQLTSQASSVGTNVSAQLFEVTATEFVSPSNEALREECFGPLAIVIRFAGRDDLTSALESANAALTFSVFTSLNDEDASWLIDLGHTRAGRVIANGYPTGVGVSWSMQHGGPWPATTASFATSVGAAGIERWLRPIAYQSVSEEFLPEAVRDGNPLGFPQRVDGSAR